MDYRRLSDTGNIEELKRLAVEQEDAEAQYWLGMTYIERFYKVGNIENIVNGVEWLEKVAETKGHTWEKESKINLAQYHECGIHPRADISEAIRLYRSIIDSNPNIILAKLYLGLLYCEGKPEHKPEEGMTLIENAIDKLIKEDGDDTYLSQYQCYRIGNAYLTGKELKKAKEYFEKSIDRCDDNYQSDRNLKERICNEKLPQCE